MPNRYFVLSEGDNSESGLLRGPNYEIHDRTKYNPTDPDESCVAAFPDPELADLLCSLANSVEKICQHHNRSS